MRHFDMGIGMSEHGDEWRKEVAAKFRAVGGEWHEFRGLCDPRGPLWIECLACHRLRTIAASADLARRALRVLDFWGFHEKWGYEVD